jgi:hypothetical protein
MLMIKSSHCPHGRLTCCSLFAGRRCLCLFRHSHDNVLLHLREYSFLILCARSSSKVSHRPHGSLADMPNRLSSFNSDRSLVLRNLYVPAMPANFPSPRWDYDGIFTCFALVLAGRRCVHQQWHGNFVIVHHHWQHSSISACSRSKFPITPMGRLLTCLPRLTLA